MAANFNKVILAGNLTRDPEHRVTPGGLSICKLGLAINRNFTTQNGEQREETTFVDVDSFGKQADVLAKYMSKGRPILIEGRLKLDSWEDKNTGQKRSRLGVVCETFQFLGGGGSGGSGGGQYNDDGDSGGYESPPRRQSSSPAPSDEGEDDIPF